MIYELILAFTFTLFVLKQTKNKNNYLKNLNLSLIKMNQKHFKKSIKDKIRLSDLILKEKKLIIELNSLLKEKKKVFKKYENEKKLKMAFYHKSVSFQSENKKLNYELNAIDSIIKNKPIYLKYTSNTIEDILKLLQS